MIKTRIIEYNINENFKNVKISQFLREKGYTEGTLSKLRHEEGAVCLNGKNVHMNHRLYTDDERIGVDEFDDIKKLTISINEKTSSEKIEPIDIPIEIVYEDEDIIVVNKPPFMPIHPSLNNYDNSLANALAFYFDTKNEPFVFRCINRLDRDTSGLTLIAKHYLAAGILAEQMNDRKIVREYTAVLCSETGEKLEAKGIIDRPIARVSGSTIERTVSETGERAVTFYEVLSEKEIIDGNKKLPVYLVKCRLKTGRTHQIRVHFKSIGFPLAGDFLYNPDNKLMGRQALHAGNLSFVHPISGEQMTFEVDYPDDIKKLLADVNLKML